MNIGKLKVRQIVKAQFMSQLADVYAQHAAGILQFVRFVHPQVQFFACNNLVKLVNKQHQQFKLRRCQRHKLIAKHYLVVLRVNFKRPQRDKLHAFLPGV